MYDNYMCTYNYRVCTYLYSHPTKSYCILHTPSAGTANTDYLPKRCRGKLPEGRRNGSPSQSSPSQRLKPGGPHPGYHPPIPPQYGVILVHELAGSQAAKICSPTSRYRLSNVIQVHGIVHQQGRSLSLLKDFHFRLTFTDGFWVPTKIHCAPFITGPQCCSEELVKVPISHPLLA